MNPGEYITLMLSVPRSVIWVITWFSALTLHSTAPEEPILSRV